MLAAFATALAAMLAAAPGEGRPPNVVLILADDLGAHELGCYGQAKIRTPSVDRLAREGQRWTQFYAGSPVCAPSRCCLMTGKHGGHAAIRNNSEVQPEGQRPLPAGEVTLADVFKRQGYATAAAGKWGLGGPGSAGDPLERGFDHFLGYLCQRHAHSHYPTYLWRDGERVALAGNDGGDTGKEYSHDLFEAESLRFVRANKERPFFLYLPFTVPHVAVQVPEDSLAEYRGAWDDPPYDGSKGYRKHPAPRAAYAAMVTRMDRTVGRLLGLLAELKLDADTLVLFTSDNGPTHNVGGADSDFFRSAGGLRGLKGSVYEGGIRVPLVARWPGRVPAGRVVETPGYFPDVLPTLAEVIGATGRLPDGVDGVSLAATLLGKAGEQKPRTGPMVWEFAGYGGQQAIRKGTWKGVRQNLQKGPAGLELYDLASDPSETTDVAAKHPGVARELERLLGEQHTPSDLFPIKGLTKR